MLINIMPPMCGLTKNIINADKAKYLNLYLILRHAQTARLIERKDIVSLPMPEDQKLTEGKKQ